MRITEIQMLLAETGMYSGAIDGDDGPLTFAAVSEAETTFAAEYLDAPKLWSRKRRLIGAGQVVLGVAGFEPGAVDGYAGHNTSEALIAWRTSKSGGDWSVDPVRNVGVRTNPAQSEYPHQRAMTDFYGVPGGPQCTQGKVDLAYPMVIAWNRRQIIRQFSCHQKLSAPLTGIFRQTLAHYGHAEVARLELNVFGGCYNFRNKRGGKTLSTHAYGGAVDLNPEKNRLRWGADRAQFAGADYVPFWNIVTAFGGTPAGHAWGKDWMHFQFARV